MIFSENRFALFGIMLLAKQAVEEAEAFARAEGVGDEPFELAASGLLARACCHELDHLDGVLFFERLSGLRKELALRRLRRLSYLQELSA